MTIKIDIGDPSTKKTFHLEASLDPFLGKKLGATVQGSAIKEFPFEGYEFEITGASSISGHPAIKSIVGTGLKSVLLTKGPGMKKKPRKEGKKIRGYSTPKGLRMKKTVHTNLITEDIMQVNLKVIKSGSNSIAKILGKEEAPKIEEKKAEEKPVETPKVEEKKTEEAQKVEEKKVEEKPVETPKVEEKKEEAQKAEEKKEEKKAEEKPAEEKKE